MLAIFDVEGVLFDAEYLPILAEEINKEDEIWDITKKGLQGTIDWRNGLETRVKALKGLDYKICKKIADELPIMTGAKTVCKTLKNAGWNIMAVSGGFTIMTDRLKKEIDLDYVFANELLFKNGKLDGVKIDVDSDKAKSAMIKINEWNQKQEEIVVVADGANDLKLFDICGFGIAFRAQDQIKDVANGILEEKDLSKILDMISKHYNITLETSA